MSLHARPRPERLIRCDLNEMLSIKICFKYKKRNVKRKNGREEFKELNIILKHIRALV